MRSASSAGTASAEAGALPREYDIPEYDAQIITGTKHMADLFEETTKICDKPKKVSNWLMGETMRLLKENSMEAEEIALHQSIWLL